MVHLDACFRPTACPTKFNVTAVIVASMGITRDFVGEMKLMNLNLAKGEW